MFQDCVSVEPIAKREWRDRISFGDARISFTNEKCLMSRVRSHSQDETFLTISFTNEAFLTILILSHSIARKSVSPQ